jgi:hypothetical protein
MADGFIPHGATCEADHRNGQDWGRCGAGARAIVEVDGRDRYVCGYHLELMDRAKVKVYHAVLGPVAK